MEQDKNKEASYDCRQTNEREQTPLGTQNEETQSAREAARREREEVLFRARRKKEICEAYDALCRLLDERKIMLAEIKAIELRNEDGEKYPEEVGSLFYRITDNNERELLYLRILTGTLAPDECAIEI